MRNIYVISIIDHIPGMIFRRNLKKPPKKLPPKYTTFLEHLHVTCENISLLDKCAVISGFRDRVLTVSLTDRATLKCFQCLMCCALLVFLIL